MKGCKSARRAPAKPLFVGSIPTGASAVLRRLAFAHHQTVTNAGGRKLGAEGWKAPEEGLEPPTRSLSEPGAPISDRAAAATTGAEVPPVERPTSKKSPPKPSPKPSPRKQRS